MSRFQIIISPKDATKLAVIDTESPRNLKLRAEGKEERICYVTKATTQERAEIILARTEAAYAEYGELADSEVAKIERDASSTNPMPIR